jgi:hypothetical protein
MPLLSISPGPLLIFLVARQGCVGEFIIPQVHPFQLRFSLGQTLLSFMALVLCAGFPPRLGFRWLLFGA